MSRNGSEQNFAETPASESDPGQIIMAVAIAVGAAWIVMSILAVVHFFGGAKLDAIAIAMLAAAAIMPALMVWLAGASAREGVRARYEAKRLADAAADLINPSARAEVQARRLAQAVRGEITGLDRALEQTIARLHEVEASISRQTHAVNSIAAQAKSGANSMISGLEHERTELLRIADDLNGQAALIGQAISRHTQAIAESARIAEAEVRAADELLESRIHSFGAAAALISDRTHALTGAAAASADSALRLETALSAALDTLAKATNLTESARLSAEAATRAADSTAGAVHDVTTRAIEDARRAADMIRGEAASVERDADRALNTLREAADNARSAARAARTAVEPVDPPPKPQKPDRRMPTFSRGPAEIARTPPPPQIMPPQIPPAPPPEPPPALEAETAAFSEPSDSPLHPAAPPNNGGAWTWRELLSSMDEGGAPNGAANGQPPQAPPPRRRVEADDPIARLTQAVTEQRGASPIGAVQIIERAGVQMSEVFTVAALDRIAHRARNGSQARRKAVRDAVGPAIVRLKDHLRRDQSSRNEAAGFLRSDGARVAELLSRGRASMSADATRAFLLLDAAEG
jgi:hypothetical protein